MNRAKRISLALQQLAHEIDDSLSAIAGERAGFVLVLQLDDIAQYVSNCSRIDGAALIESLLSRWRLGKPDLPEHYGIRAIDDALRLYNDTLKDKP
jgi:hypothetical protein